MTRKRNLTAVLFPDPLFKKKTIFLGKFLWMGSFYHNQSIRENIVKPDNKLHFGGNKPNNGYPCKEAGVKMSRSVCREIEDGLP